MDKLEFVQAGSSCGTSLMGYWTGRESTLRRVFGEPGEGDGYKVSRHWALRVFDLEGQYLGRATIYDWKETSLYDDELASPDELTALDDDREWHIGGDSKDAVAWVNRLIEQAQTAPVDVTKLREAARLLAEWLTDNTEEVFEEIPEIDEARNAIESYIGTQETTR